MAHRLAEGKVLFRLRFILSPPVPFFTASLTPPPVGEINFIGWSQLCQPIKQPIRLRGASSRGETGRQIDSFLRNWRAKAHQSKRHSRPLFLAV